ncbi:hypothetical protein I540_2379 [Mycobacteroides abscessus subsp. bolletii 1513]|uniref:Uncharacterized protein n=1 Tax=Mycobacteroides abscessus subsp. bolletii 1513 TaxID=1299321 RepID=X8DV92_9MYCO|nr:hypothetical protein I540_2379 [Mycobacteroides abscessus subsp. bolletii 1513]
MAYTTLRALYQDAVAGFRPNQVNSVLVVAGVRTPTRPWTGPA